MSKAAKPFGVPPFQAYAVFMNGRILGGESQVPIFWTKASAKAFMRVLPFDGYSVEPVTVQKAETT